MTSDNDLQAAILEETMKEAMKSSNPDLITSMLHNLNEIGAEGQMSKAYKVNPERDETYITLYNTVDGTESNVLRTMVPKLIRKRFPRIPEVPPERWGTLAFALTPPKDLVPKAKMLCDLHPKNARREWLDEIGLAGRLCNKSNLRNAFEVARHRRAYHHDEDGTIVAAEARELAEETRNYQKSIAEILAGRARASVKDK
jgi:hypothetical protein